MEKTTKILICIFLLALIIRIIPIFIPTVKWWDETIYLNLGYDLSKNPLDYSFKNNGWGDFNPSSDENYAWPKAGFRAPLLPYTIAIFYFFKLDFLLNFLMPFIGALSIILIFILGKKLLGEKAALYSALLLAVIPIHVSFSSLMLTDVFSTFLVILAFLVFWKGYEENNKKYKVIFGLILALALLLRYTILWIIPIFLIYLIIRNKGLKFLKDKYLWYSVILFFIVLAPLFIYGSIEYGNPLGAFIHGSKALGSWGGVQSWSFVFENWQNIFSYIGIIFLIALAYIIYKKEFLKKEVYLLLIWIFFFLIIASTTSHKEERYFLPLIPAICLISGFFLAKIKYKKIALLIIILLAAFLVVNACLNDYKASKKITESEACFLEGNKFIKNLPKSIIITDESPLIYFYSKQETRFYPNPWSLASIKALINSYKDKQIYAFFTEYDMPLSSSENKQIKADLDKFELIFECKNNSWIYKL